MHGQTAGISSYDSDASIRAKGDFTMQDGMHYTLGSIAFWQAYQAYRIERRQQAPAAREGTGSGQAIRLRDRIGGALVQMRETIRGRQGQTTAPAKG